MLRFSQRRSRLRHSELDSESPNSKRLRITLWQVVSESAELFSNQVRNDVLLHAVSILKEYERIRSFQDDMIVNIIISLPAYRPRF